jgi:hypothetical protein
MEREHPLATLVAYLVLVIIVIGLISIVITAITGSELAQNLVNAAFAPLPLWAFLIIIAAMIDEIEAH